MDKSEEFWDKQAGDYADQEQHVNLSENKDFRTTLKYLNISDTVLDYGCGGGLVANAIAEKVKEVHAIDISSRMIEIGKAKADERKIKNIHYAQATIFDDRYQKESFNMILSFRVLHVLEDARSAIRRINELLKPGGVFISVTTCMGAYRFPIGTIASMLEKIGVLHFHINWFKLRELQKILTAGGFQIAECEKMDDRIPTYCIVARKL